MMCNYYGTINASFWFILHATIPRQPIKIAIVEFPELIALKTFFLILRRNLNITYVAAPSARLDAFDKVSSGFLQQ